jgi:hypothetical protein
MDSSESFLKTTVERVRAYLDDGDFDAKYNDAYLVSHVIMPSMVDVQSRLALNASNNVLLRFNLSLVANQESYVLPPCVGEILRVVKYNDPNDGTVATEWRPRNHFSLGGPVWILEGSMISFRPFPTQNEDIVIEYSSNGDMRPHYHLHSGGTDVNNAYLATTTTFKFADTPTLGMRDKRLHAYAGQTLRLYGSVYHEERIISAYDASTRTATVSRPFTLTAATNYSYEVCPPNSQAYVEAVTLASAIKLGTWRKVSQSHHALLIEQYRMAIKTITDNLSNMQARTGKSWTKDTPDNPDWRP